MSDAGYMIPLGEIMTPLKQSLHCAFRIFTISVIVVFDLQHVIYIFQVLDNMDLIVESLFTLIVTFNVTFKLFVIYFNTHRFEQLRDAINCPLFKSNSTKEEEYMKKNERLMNTLATTTRNTVILCDAFWFIIPFINRTLYGRTSVPFYVPFSTSPIIGFTAAVTYVSAVMLWVGTGHLAYICFIGALYSHSCVQLRIIRYKLEHIADDGEDTDGFKDEGNAEIQARFVHCVKRYDMVFKFITDVENILSSSVFMQFLCSAGAICMVVYEMSIIPSALSAQFFYMALYLACLLMELYLICHFGTMVQYESECINNSVYLSDWLSFSPSFRRQILIAMTRWTKIITPLAANLVPLSINTFLKVLRMAYTLYTVLKESS